MKYIKFLFTIILPLASSIFVNGNCLQNCQEMFSSAKFVCHETTFFLAAVGGATGLIASAGCYVAAAAAYGICVKACS